MFSISVVRPLLRGLALLVCFVALFSCLCAQLVINEYSCANRSDFADGFGEYEDWIELYNPGAAAVNLAGWSLSDKVTNPTKWTFSGGSIPAGGHLVVFASNRNLNVSPGPFHTNFKLTQTKNEPIVLSNPTGVLVDQVITQPTQRDHAYGRLGDGAANWGVFLNPTPNAANTGGKQPYTAKPTMSVAPGFYSSAVSVTLSSPDPLATVRYTLNGSTPTTTSPAYSGPIAIATTQMLRARAFSSDPNVPPSFVETNTYFINVNNHNLPVLSLGSEDYVPVLFATKSEIISSFEYFDAAQTFRMETSGDMRGHGNDSWAYNQKGMRFHVRDQDGYTDAIYEQLFPATPRAEFPVVIIKAAGSDSYPGSGFLQSCHLRDAYVQTISQSHGLDLDERSYQACIVYINGQYWGLYDMRERVDDDYTNFYYNQEEKDVDMLEYWGGLTVELGSDTAWVNLYNFMQANDLSIPANYQHVTDRFEVGSLIDYFILNTYTVNTDWLNWNTSWWRGRKGAGKKWRYSLWDQDNTFNLGQNYTGVGTPTFENDPCDVENLPQFEDAGPNEGHVDMLRWLFANPDFKNQYLVRYADLVNTTFRCDTMLAIFDRMANHIAPEMPNQTTRWGGTVTGWNANLDSMRAQITGRCAVVSQGLIDCYSLYGPFPIVVEVSPVGAGKVKLSSVDIANYPWSGSYYGNTTLPLVATPNATYVFDHWEVNTSTLTGAVTNDSVKLPVTGADTVVAVFRIILSAGADVAICAGQSATLTAVGSTNCTWTDLVGTPAGSGNSITVAPATTTKYVVSAPIGTDTVTVTVTPLPVFSLGKDTLICATGSIALSVPAAPGRTVSWQNGATGNTFTATAPGTYIATASVAGCVWKDTLVMSAAPASIISLGPDVALCGASSLTINPVTSFGPPTWQDGSVKSSFVATAPGTYSVALARYGCTYRDTVRITPEVPLTFSLGPDTLICPSGGSIALTTPAFPGGTITWQNGTTGGTFTATQPGTYIARATIANCVSADTLVMRPAPASILSLGPDVPTCAGNTFILTAITAFGPPVWQDGSVQHTFAAPDTGKYWASLVRYGCTYTDTVRVIEAAPLQVFLGADRMLCPETGPALLIPTVQGGPPVATTWRWQNNSPQPTQNAFSEGTYWVEANRGGCKGRDSVFVARNLLFEYDPAESQEICQGDTVEISVAVPGATWRWDQDSLENVPLLVSRSGEYGVTLFADGCSRRDVFMFTSERCPICEVVAPTAFTPNGDGVKPEHNETLRFYAGCPVVEWELHVYNRAGQEVFVSHAFAEEWTAQGEPEGVYAFTLRAVLMGEWNKSIEISKSGTIAIIR